MEKTYTFIADTINESLFFGRYNTFSLSAEDPWSASGSTKFDDSPRKPYIATSKLADGTTRYWRCKAYFGKYATQLDELKTQNITNIKLSFSACNHGSYDHPYYWDTAANAPSFVGGVTCDFVSEHKADGIRTVALPSDTVGIRKSIVLNVTEYGIPDSYSWLFRSSIATYVSLCNDDAQTADQYDNLQVKLIIKVQEPDIYKITYNPGIHGDGAEYYDEHSANTLFFLSSAGFTYKPDAQAYIQDGWVTKENPNDCLGFGSQYSLSANTDLYPHWGKPKIANRTDLSSQGLQLQSIFLAQ